MYFASKPPDDPKELSRFLWDELQKLQAALNQPVPNLRLQELNVAPTKPRKGDVALADGTNWNPGAGAGYYGYRGGAWHLLG